MVFSIQHAFLAAILAGAGFIPIMYKEARADTWISGLIVLAGFALIGGFLGAWKNRRDHRRNSN